MFDNKNPNQMLVEGFDDLYSVIGLMRAHIDWPDDKNRAPVYIHVGNGAEEILKDAVLTTFLKSPVIQRFAVMLDADAKPESRYARVRHLCEELLAKFPEKIPRDGLIVENPESHKRFGLWIMPDNISEGCLETFLRFLVPNQGEQTWKYATECVNEARRLGCPCSDPHVPKADLYTWLAWQEPPGQSPGVSLTKKILDPKSNYARPFVKWFRSLFSL